MVHYKNIWYGKKTFIAGVDRLSHFGLILIDLQGTIFLWILKRKTFSRIEFIIANGTSMHHYEYLKEWIEKLLHRQNLIRACIYIVINTKWYIFKRIFYRENHLFDEIFRDFLRCNPQIPSFVIYFDWFAVWYIFD